MKNQKKRNSKRRWIIAIIILILLIAGLFYGFFYYKLMSYQADIYGPNNCKPGYDCVVIEDEGKKNVAEREDVKLLAEKYSWEHMHIKALDIHLAHDYDFLKILFPEFKKGDIGCIILVLAGDEGFVFIENEELEIIGQESLSSFVDRTKTIDFEIMAKFYLSLR